MSKKAVKPQSRTQPDLIDYVPYHKSITDLLRATKDTVRSLVKHWPSDGRFKETLLAGLLRRFLPETFTVGTGFIVSQLKVSGEIDVLIVDKAMPTLFKQDDLLIVTPESVRAVIEVKTRIETKKDWFKICEDLAARKVVATRRTGNNVWAGLFVFEGPATNHKTILNAVHNALWTKGAGINCVSQGEDSLVKYCNIDALAGGCWPDHCWYGYDCPGVAHSHFILALLEYLIPKGRRLDDYALNPVTEGFKSTSFIGYKSDAVVTDVKQWRASNECPPFMPELGHIDHLYNHER